MLIDALEVSLVLVALPAAGADLGLSMWAVQWAMSGFALGFGALLPLGPRITARWGRRPVYLAALLVFVAASLAGYLADGIAVLVATRVVKGMCAALTAPTGLAIVADVFPEGPEQRRAVSVYALFGAAGFTVGLLLSGALTEADWRWTLVFPAPVALVLLVAAVRLVPGDAPDRADRPAPPRTADLLRDRSLLRSAAGAATLNGTYLGLLLLSTFEVQTEWGWSPWWTALAFLPACLPPALTTLHAGRMAARFGTARLVALGALAAATGYALRAASPVPDSYAAGLLPTLLLVGAAFVLSFAALNMQATAGLPPAARGPAVALYQTAVQAGAAVTLSLVAALRGVSGSDRPALLLVTALGLLGLLVALTGLSDARGRVSATAGAGERAPRGQPQGRPQGHSQGHPQEQGNGR
ncbi:hypothetical protein GCM10010405_07750 [Streptomyces macrosporus]|uniref:Major facilitator superfamily (MFS) profile domain-containing protein n=2 Tax=Streptomyces macrosporus TaxID=44032 RepID=A0ABN3JFT0_9ACTN